MEPTSEAEFGIADALQPVAAGHRTSSTTPRVSVVVPLFNKAREIEATLASVLAQTVRDLEVVVVDDGSTDGGGARAAAFGDPRIRVIRQDNRGASAARNLGVAAARAEILALLDADDLWSPDFLATVLTLSERFPDAGLWASAYRILDGRGLRDPLLAAIPRRPEGDLLRDFFRSMLGPPLVSPCNVLLAKRVFDEAGGFTVGERLAEDFDLWARIALRRPVAFTPLRCAVKNATARNRVSRMHRFTGEETGLARALRSSLRSGRFETTTRRSVELFLGKHLLKVARHRIKENDGVRARELIAEAWELGTFRPKCAKLWGRSYLRPMLRRSVPAPRSDRALVSQGGA